MAGDLVSLRPDDADYRDEQRMDQLRAQGTCDDCDAPAAEGYTLCVACLQFMLGDIGP